METTRSEMVLGPPPVRDTIGASVYRRLREAILIGRIPMGTRINELELASAWQISRTPIRDALQRLEAEGLVQATAGRGMLVPRLSSAEVEELYAVREALEGMAARRAAERTTTQFLAHLNTQLKNYGVALKQEDVVQLVAADGALHDVISQMAQNHRLEQAIQTTRSRVHQVHARSFRLRGRASKTFRELAKVVAAIRTKDAARAEVSLREHLASLRSDVIANFDELMAAEPP